MAYIHTYCYGNILLNSFNNAIRNFHDYFIVVELLRILFNQKISIGSREIFTSTVNSGRMSEISRGHNFESKNYNFLTALVPSSIRNHISFLLAVGLSFNFFFFNYRSIFCNLPLQNQVMYINSVWGSQKRRRHCWHGIDKTTASL